MQAPTQHPTPAHPVTPPPQRRRKAWAFAAAFILVVVAVGIAALVERSGDESPVAEEPMTPQVESLTWSRVPHDEAVFNPTMGKDMMWSVTVEAPDSSPLERPAPATGSYRPGRFGLRLLAEPWLAAQYGTRWTKLRRACRVDLGGWDHLVDAP